MCIRDSNHTNIHTHTHTHTHTHSGTNKQQTNKHTHTHRVALGLVWAEVALIVAGAIVTIVRPLPPPSRFEV